MVVAGLVAITLSTAWRNVVEIAALEEKALLETRLEASVEMIVLDLIKHGRRSRWLNSPGIPEKLTIDGAEVEASVTDVRGLVDVNSTDPVRLEQLITSRLEGEPARHVIERLRESRASATARWGTYVDMSVALELPIEQFVSLQPHITLFSILEQPDSRYATDALKGLLRLDGPEQKDSVISEEATVYGHTYKIIASTSGPLIFSVDLVAELLLTGKTDQPYVLRSWIWVPHPPKTPGRVP